MIDECFFFISFLMRGGINIPAEWGLEKTFKDLVWTLILKKTTHK